MLEEEIEVNSREECDKEALLIRLIVVRGKCVLSRTDLKSSLSQERALLFF